jgi:hypothetical protein
MLAAVATIAATAAVGRVENCAHGVRAELVVIRRGLVQAVVNEKVGHLIQVRL